jgi:hypothetical protein
MTWTYDERGNIIDEAFFNEAGKPVACKDGYARSKSRYDEYGTKIDISYYDPAGKPLRARVKITAVFPRTQAARLGLRPGDIVVSYRGVEVKNQYRFIADRRTERPGDSPKELRILRGDKMLTGRVAPGPLGAQLQDEIIPEAK